MLEQKAKLRRPSALAGFKAMLERRYNKKKQGQDGNNNDNNGIKIPRKNDFIDAVAGIHMAEVPSEGRHSLPHLLEGDE
jgi:hypothetical protein